MKLPSTMEPEQTGLVDMTDACPAVNTRPRDLPQFQEAAHAAEGDDVEEIDACEAFENMTLWCPDSKSWFMVKSVDNAAGSHGIDGIVPPRTIIHIHDPLPGAEHWWLVDPDRPVVRRHRGSARQTPSALAITNLVPPGFP